MLASIPVYQWLQEIIQMSGRRARKTCNHIRLYEAIKNDKAKKDQKNSIVRMAIDIKNEWPI